MDASAAPKSHGLPEAGYHGQRTRKKTAEDNGSGPKGHRPFAPVSKVTVEESTTLVDVTMGGTMHTTAAREGPNPKAIHFEAGFRILATNQPRG